MEELHKTYSNEKYLTLKLNLQCKSYFTVTYHSAIVVLRNPYHARIAEFNRRNSHGHTKSIEEQEFFAVGMNFFLNFLFSISLYSIKLQS